MCATLKSTRQTHYVIFLALTIREVGMAFGLQFVGQIRSGDAAGTVFVVLFLMAVSARPGK